MDQSFSKARAVQEPFFGLELFKVFLHNLSIAYVKIICQNFIKLLLQKDLIVLVFWSNLHWNKMRFKILETTEILLLVLVLISSVWTMKHQITYWSWMRLRFLRENQGFISKMFDFRNFIGVSEKFLEGSCIKSGGLAQSWLL